jgi:hypothetical protein
VNEILVINEPKPLTAAEIKSQVQVIQQVMAAVMQKDVHYGVIPGCKQPSLYKPGAEKIMATFRLAPELEVNDLSDGDQIRYQVKMRLKSPSGVFVGEGIGECSSNEEKYKWRKAICDEEFEETLSDRKREKWSKGYNNAPPYKQKQIRTEPADIANTVLKMAKKRAQIDAVLTATAASDCFTQDLEDLPPEYIDGDESPQPEQPKPQARQSSPTGGSGGNGFATEKQIGLLKSKLRNKQLDEAWLCEQMGVASIGEITFAKVNDAIACIEGA